MADTLRILHYINQFYGGIGGEDKASVGLSTKDGPVGPGMLMKALLAGRGEIVKTVICGDNYISEHQAEVIPQILDIIREVKPDLVLAGPGFNAGRYGIACAALTAAVQEQLKLPCATALFSENPGTDLYKNRCYIVQTDNNAKNMKDAMSRLVEFGIKLANGETIRDGRQEGYHGSGPAIEIDYDTPACKRGVDMLLNKYYGRPFRTEVVMPNHEEIPVPVLSKPLSECLVAVVTDGGLVPRGNPDRMPPTNSKNWRCYSFAGQDYLKAEDYEVSHQGYNNAFVLQDPNRLVPVDCLREEVRKGRIGALLDHYYMTAGVMTPLDMSKKLGEGIAHALLADHVDAVILTST